MYVVDRDAMGKWNASSNQSYQDLSGALGGAVFSMPAYFNGTLYYGAVGDGIRAFPITNARIASTSSSRSARSFAYPGATPSISASGNTNGIVWAVENSNPAVLHAYNAANLAVELYNSTQAPGGRDSFGAGNKFITPMIANGRVYVGTQTGVAVFGMAAPAPPTNLRIIR
jgi:outer membrane protein assembly factor BamB